MDRGNEFIKAGKAFVVPKFFHEPHADQLAIGVTRPVEQVRFTGELQVATDRGAVAKARDAGQLLSGDDAGNHHGKDASERGLRVASRRNRAEVECRKAQCVTEMLAVHNAA